MSDTSLDRSKKPVVLIADDDRDLCDLMSLWFQDKYELLLAFDGDDALTLARRCAPQAALVDVMMPRLSGLGVRWAFAHHPKLEKLPIALMTAYHDTMQYLPRSCRTLRKPFARSDVETILDDLIEGCPAHAPDRNGDSRRTVRLPVRLPGRMTRKGRDIPGTVLSLSMLGAGFATGQALSVGSRWGLSFSHGARRYDMPVEVIHNLVHEGVDSVGLRLHDLGLDGETLLQELLEELTAERQTC